MYLIISILCFFLFFLYIRNFTYNYEKKYKKYLIMYSGGLDSLYILYHFLRNNKKVHVHHVILIDNTQRWKAEKIMSNKAINILKNKFNYEFDYTENLVSSKGMSNQDFNPDSEIISFIAAQTSLMYDCDAIVSGNLPNERLEYDENIFKGMIKLIYESRNIKNKPSFIDFPIISFPEIKNKEKIEDYFKQIILEEIKDSNIKFNKIFVNELLEMYKYKLAEYLALPPELRDLYTGCRFPKIRKNNKIDFCGKCINCKYRDLINSSS